MRIMNQLIDKLVYYRLDSSEWSIMMLIIRYTWGINGRPWADIKWKMIREKTKLPNSSLIGAMRKLRDRNIVHTLENGKQTTRYKINSKVSSWKELSEIGPSHRSKIRPSHRSKLDRSTGLIGPSHRSKLDRPTDLTPLKTSLKTNNKNIIKPEGVAEDEFSADSSQENNSLKKAIKEYRESLSGKIVQDAKPSGDRIKALKAQAMLITKKEKPES